MAHNVRFGRPRHVLFTPNSGHSLVRAAAAYWQSAGGKGEIRNTKWLKVLNGKASDVKAWMRSCRSLKVNKGTGSTRVI